MTIVYCTNTYFINQYLLKVVYNFNIHTTLKFGLEADLWKENNYWINYRVQVERFEQFLQK